MTTVFTITSHGYDIIWKDCIRSQQAYCERHGYVYHHIHLPSTLTPDTTAWMKLHFLRYFLDKDKDSCLHPKSTHFVARRNDVDDDDQKKRKEKTQGSIMEKQRVMYIDADCEIRKHCPAIESLDQSGKSLFVAPGFSGRINAGVLIAWDDLQAISLISLTIDNRKTVLPDSDQVGRVYGGGENGHIIHYRKDSPLVQLIDQRRNNNHTIALDDYIRHYSAGGPMRVLYCMDTSAKIAWYVMMIRTYRLKILRKLSLVPQYHEVAQPGGDDVVEEWVKTTSKR